MKLVLYLSASVLVVVCATWAYRVNYATQEAMNRVADLREEISAEREAIAVLTAEWEYLNRPDRLEQLVKANEAQLGLAELTPDQFGDVANAPFPPDPKDALADMVAGVVAANPAPSQGAAASNALRAAARMPLARPVGDSQ
ncbi:MAG: cell division protein FtsL [Amaricoccus sp.]|uniref:cell division protein FtsL n=1 Tax=Amaricoccus sp. TaxID=1872485 RepID=UPI0039E4E68A